MRRTYKSKKDTGSHLDQRDVLQNLDEKSSAFDAFYIQNIKQTKRELSCMGSSNHYGVASNKVRKRKYVKKAAKVVEPPPKESLSGSVFLTPDKSIRVNKALDLFDQLLNSSPAWSEPKQAKKDDVFDKVLCPTPKEAKTYRRKKPVVKKFNYSSESSESDKENSEKNNEDSTQNVTDIKSHKLIIEKEATLSPKIDESINKIVNKLSFIKNIKRQSSNESVKKPLRNRLTRNLQNSSSKTSPLCSTPFNDKTRSKSIYNFSPIPMDDLEDSLKYITINEDDNEVNKSVVFVPKTSNNALKRSQNEQTSPIVSNISNSSKNKSSKSLFSSSCSDTKDSCSKNVEKTVDKNSLPDPHSKMSEVQISSLQTSELEPFLGFSVESVAKVNEELQKITEEEKDNSIILSTTKHSRSSQKSKDSNDITNNESKSDRSNEKERHDDEVVVNISVEDNTVPSQPFLGFTKENDESAISETADLSVAESVEYSISSQRFSLPEADIKNPDEQQNTTNSTNSDDNENLSLLSQEGDKQSLYDTCSSESSLNEPKTKEPIVAIERMKMSIFQKYYEKMADYQSEGETDDEKNSISSDNFASLYDSDETSAQESEESISSQDLSSEDVSNEETTSSSENKENTICRKDTISTDEDRCISFVTTRRGNDFTKNTTILVLDDSDVSNSSSECDKTIMSNKNKISLLDSSKEDMNKIDVQEMTNKDTLNNVVIPEEDKVGTEINTKTLKETIPNSNFNQNTQQNTNIANDSLIRPGIVLQPGKKWERSLSIYRRMTMMNDHFDQSVLEDEDLRSKGRKYRQSVISTMEMQDKGSLHNESIHSRRSTFVSKPSRSTIRIVKETNNSRLSLSSTAVFGGFLEDCDDTLVELSKLSIADDHDVTVLEQFHESTRIATARDYVLRRCNQAETLLFDECYPDTVLKNCRKIGEGVYGEVFLWRAPDGRARVMKIVPIAGHTKVNGEHQKDFHEIISEIVIAMELSALRAPIPEIERHFEEGKDIDELDLHAVENATDVFNEVLAVRSVYGSYPSRLLDLWELYDECKGSENDNPAILPVDQQYIVLELANAGQDLESYQFNSAEQAHALFLQVAFALAVGEESFQFEHRDLHWGNVLIQPTEQKYCTFVIRGRAHRVARRGVAATIIDYSLSRVSLPLAREDAAALYNDLAADDSLFGALGDYQFEVYRLMRDKLGNDWKLFEPYTNILWLHYTVDKMITALRYKRTNTKTHKQYIAKLKGIKERILNYGSAAQFVLTDNEY